MPFGAEVFTISGALDAAACPAGWKATPKGNCAGPGGRSAPAAAALQNALRTLGIAAGDKALAATGVDGIVGPGTAAAVNRAFTVHIGPGQAAANLRSGRLTKYDVAQNAATLTKIVAAEVARRGGAVGPTPTPRAAAARPAARPAARYAPAAPPSKPGTAVAPAYRPPPPGVVVPPRVPSPSEQPKAGWPWWGWGLVGVGVVGLAGGTYVMVSRGGSGRRRDREPVRARERERERETVHERPREREPRREPEAKRGPEPKMPKQPSPAAAAAAGFGAALSKQHFSAIAGILCEHRVPHDVVRSFSRYFKNENPRFDMVRFENAVASGC